MFNKSFLYVISGILLPLVFTSNAAAQPGTPSANAATYVTWNSFVAHWTSVSGASYYDLQVDTNSSFNNPLSGYSGQPGTSANVGLFLTPNTTYYYRVRAVNGSGASSYSNVVQLTTKAQDTWYPIPTAQPASSITSNSFTANWSSTPGTSTYLLDVSTNSSFFSFENGYQNYPVSGTTHSITGLSAGVTYYYRVRAYSVNATSNYSGTVSAQTSIVVTPPSANNASGITKDSFTASWSPVSGATGYRLDVSLSNTFSSFVSGYNNTSIPATSTNRTVSGLSPLTFYYYRVRAVFSSATSSNSNVVSTQTAPVAPGILQGSNVESNAFTANWAGVENASGYLLDVTSSPSFGGFVPGYNNLPVTTTSYTVQGLSPATPYYYRVQAMNSINVVSVESDVMSTVTLMSAPTLQPPTYVTYNSFTINWTSMPNAIGYTIEVSQTPGFSSSVSYTNVTGTSFNVNTSISANTTYYYKIKAEYPSGVSGFSSPGQVLTTNHNFSVPVPSATAPVNITTTSFTATWSSTVNANAYLLDVALDNTFTNYLQGYHNFPVASTTHIVNNLQPGTTYFYRVRVINNALQTSEYSNVVPVTPTNPPGVPNALSPINVTQSSMQARWLSVEGAQGYRIDVSTSDDFLNIVTNYGDRFVNGATLEISNLSALTTYYYRVRAVNINGTASGNSNTITAITAPSTPPGAPSKSDITSTSFKALWLSMPGVNDYALEVSTTDNFSPASLVTGYNPLQVMATSTVVTGLTPYTTYYFRYRALNAQGTPSDNSPVSSVRTMAHNHIKTVDVTVPNKKENTSVNSANVNESSTVYAYFDGLGRPLQQVTFQGSPTKQDIVQPFSYDAFGRQTKTYLPYTAQSNGWLKEDALVDPSSNYSTELLQYRSGKHYEFYQAATDLIAHDQYPYAETRFEPAPRNRPIEKGAVGEAWQPDAFDVWSSTDKTIKYSYESNGVDKVLVWEYSLPTTAFPLGLVGGEDHYGANMLIKNLTKDEHQNQVIEYKDKSGNVVLKRVQAPSGLWADTYYVYDKLNRLVTVIPPEAVRQIVDNPSGYVSATNEVREEFLSRWAFRYVYDEYSRLIVKKIPGSAPVYMIYDNRDRLVLSQDGNLRVDPQGNPRNEWMFTKYDALNRHVLTGIADMGTKTVDVLRGEAENVSVYFETRGSTVHGYTNNAYPLVADESKYLTVTYYDDYNFGWSNYGYVNDGLSANVNSFTYNQPSTHYGFVKGQVTGIKTKVLDNTNTWLKSVNYYDNKYRLVQVITDNHKGGTDRTSTLYDFIGKALKTQTTHNNKVINRRFQYDHIGRLLRIYHKITGHDEVLVAQNAYNELGELIQKGLHKEGEETGIVTADPLVGQPGVTYVDNIEKDQYNGEDAIIAKSSIRLKSGFHVGSGTHFIARIGYSQADADVINAAAPDFLQVVDYRYNIRGWLQNINDPDAGSADDFFSMKLNYNTPSAQGGPAQYNGNISEIQWLTNGSHKQSYGYQYDPMNRLTRANYYDVTAPSENGTYNEFIWDEDNNKPGYDLNGNILKLVRNGVKGAGQGTIDKLSYNYRGNQLSVVNDIIADAPDETGFKDLVENTFDINTISNDEYRYDDNGNMIKDANKGITAIKYNHLNLVSRVEKGANEYIEYTYDAAGTKLKQQVFGTRPKTTDYVGGFVYENNVMQFVNHEEGRVVLTASEPEYQYFLKDHLGNVRVTFTSKPGTVNTSIATMELSAVSQEQNEFVNYAFARKVHSRLFDKTKGDSTGYAIRLNGTAGERYGLAKTLSVMPGDTVKLKVYAKYVNKEKKNLSAALTSALAQITTTGAGPGGVDQGVPASQSTLELPFAGVPNKPDGNSNSPKAYLNYLVFDRNYHLLLHKSGYKKMSDTANEDGSDVEHDTLTQELVVTEPGYVYTYLSNEGDKPMDVFFDNFTVTNVSGYIVAIDDYYPFGLAFNSYNKENSTPNDYKYNGKEEQTELGLGWLDYGMRMYQPELGRFFVQDRFSEKYSSLNPYQYAANNPVLFIDVNGDSINVAEQYRNQFTQVLQSVFGTNSSSFTYSAAGNLVFTGNTEDFSEAELSAFNDMNGVMGETTITNIVFEKSYTITDNDGNKLTIDPSKSGGEATALVGENDISQNYVVIDPVKTSTGNVYEVTDAYYKKPIDPNGPPRFNVTSQTTSVENRTLHGLGHVIHRGQSQDKVIDFDNKTRAITKSVNSLGYYPSPLPGRKYDETHNRTVKTGVYGN